MSEGDITTSADRVAMRNEYRKLAADLIQQEDNTVSGDTSAYEGLRKLIERTEDLYGGAKEVQEVAEDAKVLKHISRFCKIQAEDMSANATQFHPNEFAEKLVDIMKGVRHDDGSVQINLKRLVLLGRKVRSVFQPAPTFTYMQGALRMEPPEPKEKKQRDARLKTATKISDLRSTQAVELEEGEKSENQTEQLVVHTRQWLINRFKENNKVPLDYFRFVINPTCFGTSIENMFHCSFLIKEGTAQISLGDNGLPQIQPLRARKTESAKELDAKNQVVMNMSMLDWQIMVKNLNIGEPLIPPVRETSAGNHSQIVTGQKRSRE